VLILESNLIDGHKPKCNVHRKDDTRSLYITASELEVFSQVVMVCRMERAGELMCGSRAELEEMSISGDGSGQVGGISSSGKIGRTDGAQRVGEDAERRSETSASRGGPDSAMGMTYGLEVGGFCRVMVLLVCVKEEVLLTELSGHKGVAGCVHQSCHCCEKKCASHDDPADFAYFIQVEDNAPELLRRALIWLPVDAVVSRLTFPESCGACDGVKLFGGRWSNEANRKFGRPQGAVDFTRPFCRTSRI
jgi:hypothetical protein